MGDLGAYHLADNPNLYEIQRTNNFEFSVTGLNDILKPGLVGDETSDYIQNGEEVLRFSVASFTAPSFSQEPIRIRRFNNEVKFAGTPSFRESTLVINDYIGADGKSVLLAWQQLSYNTRQETVGNASSYKKDATLSERTPDGQLVRYWELKGCWVSDCQPSDFNYERGEKATVQATIQYDYAILHYPD